MISFRTLVAYAALVLAAVIALTNAQTEPDTEVPTEGNLFNLFQKCIIS